MCLIGVLEGDQRKWGRNSEKIFLRIMKSVNLDLKIIILVNQDKYIEIYLVIVQ